MACLHLSMAFHNSFYYIQTSKKTPNQSQAAFISFPQKLCGCNSLSFFNTYTASRSSKFSYSFIFLSQGCVYFSTHTATCITNMEYSYTCLNNSLSIHYNLQMIQNSSRTHMNVTATST